MMLMFVSLRLLCVILCLGQTSGYTEEFEYVVVGAGSAGSVLSNRLSEKHRVLLLEKGGKPNIITEVPGLLSMLYYTKNADKYTAEKQPGFGLGLKKQKVGWMRGTGLGGSSLVNFIMYVRGFQEDYNRWADKGNPGWSYADVVEAFKKFENVHLPYVNGSLRGIGGELDVVEVPFKTKIGQAFVEGCKEFGMKQLRDYNEGSSLGVGYLQSNLRFGRRCHAEKAFLHDIRDRKGLVIKTGALVTKLRINKTTNTVEGVEYEFDESVYYARATKEVILSAGAFASPQILMLSGIGPKDHLEEMGIEVIKDLPVGKVIRDHIGFMGAVFNLNASVASTVWELFSPIDWGKFLLACKGPFTAPEMVTEAVGFVNTGASNDSLPDIEFIFMSGSFNVDFGIFSIGQFRISDEAYDAVYKHLEGKQVWSVVPLLFHPESKGCMKLRSTNPRDLPLLYANYYSDPEGTDMKTMIAAIRMVQKIAKMPSLARYGSEMHLAAAPGCKNEVVDSDSFWECQLRHLTISIWHQTGSCRMGPLTDPQAVVDHKLRVHGMKKLRIADTSVIPVSLTGHTNAPTMMVGQRAADLILNDE